MVIKINYKNYTNGLLHDFDYEGLYRATALSKDEVRSLEKVRNIVSFLNQQLPYDSIAYVGNVAIKSFIGPEYRGKTRLSRDLDVAILENMAEADLESRLEGYGAPIEVATSPLIDLEHVKFLFNVIIRRTVYSPFEAVHLTADGRTMDIFTYSTGVGPIPLNEKDRFQIVDRYGLPVVSPGFLLAANLNPRAITKERMGRAALMLESNGLAEEDYETLLRKLTEAIEAGNIEPFELSKSANILRNSGDNAIFKRHGVLDAVSSVHQEYS